MRLALAARQSLWYWARGTLQVHPLEGPEGSARYEQLLTRLRELGGADYLGLGPEYALLRQGLFPHLPGFPLDEAVLAEAERSPLFRGEEVLAAYLSQGFEDHKKRVLYAAIPQRASALLTQKLRLRRLEPLPLLVWRQARSQSESARLMVLENLTHTLAYFENGGLVGFRYLSLPVDQDSPALNDEIVRSLRLFGAQLPVEEAWLVGLPDPFGPPAGLPTQQVRSLAELAPEWAFTPEFSLDLRYKARRFGQSLPRDVQLVFFLSAVLLTAGLLAQSYLQTQARSLEGLKNQLAAEQELISVQLAAAKPQGVGLEELLRAASARPDQLWFTRLEVNQEQISLQGEALSPYAPLELTQSLGARLVSLGQQERGGRKVYTWEVQFAKAEAR